MEILLEAGGLPERGNLIVPVGHDGTLSAAAEFPGCAADGLVRRALAAVEGGVKHGRIVDLLLPRGLSFDRLLLLTLGKAEGLRRTDLLEAGGALAVKLRALKIREATLASADGSGARRAARRGRAGPGAGRAAARLSVHALSYRRRQGRGGISGLERLRVLADGAAALD